MLYEVITTRLADVVSPGVPVVDDYKIIISCIIKKTIEGTSDHNIEIEKQYPLPLQATQIIVTQSGFFLIGIIV